MLSTKRTAERRKKQLAFFQSDSNIVVGERKILPVDLEALLKVDEKSPMVETVFDSGLTAIVYKLKIGGRFYTLKKAREKILVENVDGQTSFLNEVQKRKILHEAKASDTQLYDGIVETVFADFRKGIILSKWIEGKEVSSYNEELFDHLFKTLFALMKAGIFENDPTTGNIICKDDRITLFDFGYAYDMNPLEDLNMEGFEAPVLHPAERFEARAFMIHMFDVEAIHGMDKACDLYALEKQVASRHYKAYADWLEAGGGNSEVISYFRDIAAAWDKSLSTEEGILSLYKTEKFRAFLIDVIDDISGRSCTPDTILKADYIYDRLKLDHHQLVESGALKFEDLYQRSYSELLTAFESYKTQSRQFQLKNLEKFNQWKKSRQEETAKAYCKEPCHVYCDRQKQPYKY